MTTSLGSADVVPHRAEDPSAAEVARLRAELDTWKRWVARAADVCERAVRGDLEHRVLSIDVGGDLGRLLHGVNDVLDVTDAFVRESAVSLRCASEGNFHRKIVPNGLRGAYRHAADATNEASRELARRTGELAAAQDARQKLSVEFEDFVKAMVARLGAATDSLSATTSEIVLKVETARHQAEAVDGASREVSSEVRSVAGATERLVASAAEIAGQTKGSTTLCRAALDEAARGAETVSALADASRKIGSVLKLIADIAHQTNLLALNATIEAARAGAAGRGFAVVASAVKGLARQTAGATEDIEREITGMRTATSRTVTAIERMSGTVHDLDAIATSIAHAVEEQRASTTHIGQGLTRAAERSHDVAGTIAEVCSATQTSATSLAGVLAAVHDVGQEVQTLRNEAGRFLSHIRAE